MKTLNKPKTTARLTILLILFSSWSFAQAPLTKIGKGSTTETEFKLLESSEKENIVEFKLNAYKKSSVTTPKGSAQIISIPDGAWIMEEGAPDLPQLAKSVIIPDQDEMQIEIIKADFIELKNIEVSPSKGKFTRSDDPSKIPYTYGPDYGKDEFYPGKLASLRDPHIIRKFRGQTIVTYPLQYNPVTKVLRVYHTIQVKISSTGKIGKNTLDTKKSTGKISNEFDGIYGRHFINYKEVKNTKYYPLNDGVGRMLIVCYSGFLNAMSDFVTWKESIGYTVDLVDYSTIGSESALVSYVYNYYQSHSDFLYFLIVGDHGTVPASYTSSGDSDNYYGYVAGQDSYLDIFVGRFPADDLVDVDIMTKRVIYYERDTDPTQTSYFKYGVGSASNEGPGDNNEYDDTHMNNIESDLYWFGYTSIARVYQDGGSASQMTSEINAGVGVINYVGHGVVDGWSSLVYTSTNVYDDLVNITKFPFIFSVACSVGDFVNYDCFAESWLKASYGSDPAGAIGFVGSTILQPWNPPMAAQDEMNNVLVGLSSTASIKRTYAGCVANGFFAMIDKYGSEGIRTADTWTIFGDPSVQLRTPGTPDGPAPSATCDIPTGLSANNISTSSATLNWNVSTGAVDYTVAYRESGVTTWTNVAASSNSYNLTGLTSNTTYEWGVQANCSDGTATAWTSISTFYTSSGPCTGTATVPYAESFENTIGEWTQGSADDLDWTILSGSTPSSSTGPSAASDGSYYIYIEASSPNYPTKVANLTSPCFDLTSASSPQIEFQYHMYGADMGSLILEASTDDGTTWATIWSMSGDQGNSWYTATVSLASYTGGTVKFNFMGTTGSNYTSDICIDDFNITDNDGGGTDTQAPSVPSNLSSSNISQTSAVLNWNASSDNVAVTSYDIYRDGSYVGSSTGTSYTATGLTAATTYSFTVFAKDAAENTSASSSSLSVTTLPSGSCTNYCASSGSSQTYEWIAGIAVGSYSNTSGASAYTDNIGTTISLTPGTSTNLTLTPGFSGSAYTEYWSVWIDYNNDCDFVDAGEQVFTGNSNAAISGSFTVPSSASGQTRMRVSMKYNAAPTECNSIGDGEVEDYTVSFGGTKSAPVKSATEIAISVNPNPSDGNTSLKVTSDIIGTGIVSIYNVNGQVVYNRKIEITTGVTETPLLLGLPSGIYTLLVNIDGTLINKQIVIE